MAYLVDIPKYRTAAAHVRALDEILGSIRDAPLDHDRIVMLGRQAAAHARQGADLLSPWTASPSSLWAIEQSLDKAGSNVTRITQLASESHTGLDQIRTVLEGLPDRPFAYERQKAVEEFASEPGFNRDVAAEHLREIVVRDPAGWGIRERARLKVLTDDLSYNDRPQMNNPAADKVLSRINVREASVEELRTFAATWQVWLDAPTTFQQLREVVDHMTRDKATFQRWLARAETVANELPDGPLVDEIRIRISDIKEHFRTRPGPWWGERDFAELGELRSKLDLYAMQR
jgi:hypothetical protein